MDLQSQETYFGVGCQSYQVATNAHRTTLLVCAMMDTC